jgi:hypothetical protein
MPYALCPMPYALCPMPYARRVPHVTEKGYIQRSSVNGELLAAMNGVRASLINVADFC